MTRTPHSPERVEMKAVTSIIPKTRRSASAFVTPKIVERIFTMARLTQPMITRLMGTPR